MIAPAGERTALDVPDPVGYEINAILTHPEDAFYSFRPVPEPPDLLDLQASNIQRLRDQRTELLRCFRIKNNLEALEQPERFFQTITAEFTTLCHPRVAWSSRRVWTHDADNVHREHAVDTAHAVSFARHPRGLRPVLQVQAGYVDGEPRRYQATTKLHHQEDWQYVFVSTPGTFKVYREGYDRGGVCQIPVKDEAERATLLQALGVEMLDAVTSMRRHRKKTQAVQHETARRRTYELLRTESQAY